MNDRESIAAYFEHLSIMRLGVIDLTGLPAHEMYAMVASWVRNRLDEEWTAEVEAARSAEGGIR